jgi:WS/DGAT/MGAT family acyltransferase
MARYGYDRLTALDNSFLVLEKPNSYMHVASTQIFEAGPLRRKEGGIDAERIKHATESLLHLIPRYRQKLAYVPLENSPVWIDDERFNIDYHVRHTSLPCPGTDDQLKRLSSRIMQQHLDRSRPLWEMWVVEGLEGDRFAIISKVHHCMIDGVSGVDLLMVLLSTTPDFEPPKPPPYIPRPAPSRLELLRDEVVRRATMPLQALRSVRSFVREARDVRRDVSLRTRALAEALGTSLRRASATPLNEEIGPHRRFDWLKMDLAEVKELRKDLGGSLNDVVLCVATGAVRSFFQQRRVSLDEIQFRILAPVSVRSEDERGQLGNRVSAWIVDLPIAEPDRAKQLALISERTAELKESKQAVGAELLTQVAEWTPSTLLALGARNVTRLLPFNMVVTNVPGPQIAVYLLGAKLLEIHPHVPLADTLGLGIALMSYNGQLCWGFNADYDLVPDLGDFVEAIQGSFAELRALARERREGTGKAGVKPRSRPRRKASSARKSAPRASETSP